MNRSIIVGVAVAAALLTVGAASALAAPPKYTACLKAAKIGKTYTGAYSDKTCTTPAPGNTGKYELGALAKLPAKVKSKIGHVDIYLYNPLTKTIEGHFECSSGKAKGTITSVSEGTATISYAGCQATGQLAGPCNSPGQKTGRVETEPLATRLVWLDEAETVPGIQFKPASEGGDITKVVCVGGAETAELIGTMTARIEPTGAVSKEQTITFAADEATGAPEYAGSYEEGAFSSEPLLSNLSGIKTYSDVPTSQGSVFEQKGPDVLIGA
jgi:hypothetical protein